MHGATEAAVRVPEEKHGVPTTEACERDGFPVEGEEIEGGRFRSDGEPLRWSRLLERLGDEQVDPVAPGRDKAADRPVGGDQHRAGCPVGLEGGVEPEILVEEDVLQPVLLGLGTDAVARSVAHQGDRQPVDVLALPLRDLREQGLAGTATRAREEQQQRQAGGEELVERHRVPTQRSGRDRRARVPG